jgi:hypothetical protein
VNAVRPVIALIAASILAAPSLHAQRHRGAPIDTTDWLEDCRSGNNNWNGDYDRARSCEVRKVAVAAPKGRLMIDAGRNGGINVIGGEGDSMIVVARIAASGRTTDQAAAIARQVQLEITPSSVRANGPATDERNQWYVSFDVIVPRGSDISATTRNGGIHLEGLNGKVDARAENGPVSIVEMGGDVTGRTQNGPVIAELRGTKWEGAGLDLQTTNGPVTLSIPDGYNAHVETGTVNGPMSIDFPITIQGRITKQFSFDIGKGGAPVRVVTTNGPLVVRKL